MISPQHHRKLMKKYQQHKNLSRAAREAGVDRRTARKYAQGEPGPLEVKGRRSWSTHPNAFIDVWREVEAQLQREPLLQAKVLFTDLQRRHPGKFLLKQRRSFERRVRRWKVEHGKEPVAIFRQEHRPGERLQLDWWDAAHLEIIIAGVAYDHKLVAVVMPYSNWQWAQPSRSESFLSLKAGLQAALWEMGAVPEICQTDNSSTATHPRGKGARGREFNERYLSLLAHYGMQAATIALGSPEQNGDVESGHRHLKEALWQSLVLRGSREFATVALYTTWIEEALRERNAIREPQWQEERMKMSCLPSVRLPEYEEWIGQVSRESLVRVGKQAYSVPARYIGQRLRVHIDELWVNFYIDGKWIQRVERQTGSQGVYVDWRHILPQLQRRPGAMARWRHRACLFPGRSWREAYDDLLERLGERRAEREYLGILAFALDHGLEAVEAVLKESRQLCIEEVGERLGVRTVEREEKIIAVDFQAELSGYDTLLSDELHAVQRKEKRGEKEVTYGS